MPSSYCFGGATCVRIGGSGLVNSVVIVHPSSFSMNQVKAIEVPTAWVCAEGENAPLRDFFEVTDSQRSLLDDMVFPNSFRSECEAEFAARKGKENFVEYEFQEYKGMFTLFWCGLTSYAHALAI